MAFLQNFKQGARDKASRFGSGLVQKAKNVGQGTKRRDQLLAALCLPFVAIGFMEAAKALLSILLAFVPIGFPATDFIRFLLGTLLAISAMALLFAWVKTGGFRIFAQRA